jgi:hypothetical protein
MLTHNDIFPWDQTTNLWKKEADFGGTKRPSASVFSIGNKGYIRLGTTGSTDRFYMDFWEFDPSLTTGIDEMAGNKIHFYPNPTAGKFTINNINTQSKNFKLEIYNLLGERIYSNSGYVPQSSEEVDLSGSPKGVYIVKMNNGEKFFSGKVIIQ